MRPVVVIWSRSVLVGKGKERAGAIDRSELDSQFENGAAQYPRLNLTLC